MSENPVREEERPAGYIYQVPQTFEGPVLFTGSAVFTGSVTLPIPPAAPGGVDGTVQYNKAGVFGGILGTYWNSDDKEFTFDILTPGIYSNNLYLNTTQTSMSVQSHIQNKVSTFVVDTSGTKFSFTESAGAYRTSSCEANERYGRIEAGVTENGVPLFGGFRTFCRVSSLQDSAYTDLLLLTLPANQNFLGASIDISVFLYSNGEGSCSGWHNQLSLSAYRDNDALLYDLINPSATEAKSDGAASVTVTFQVSSLSPTQHVLQIQPVYGSIGPFAYYYAVVSVQWQAMGNCIIAAP